MPITAFPSLEQADDNGLLAVGGDTEVASLLLAYRSGIFPWPLYEDVLTWFAPPQRGVLFLNETHFSRSFQKFLRKQPFHLRVNHDFDSVIHECRELIHRGEQNGTWITDEIVQGYVDLHRAGSAYSIEAYADSELVGGLYGVQVGAMVSGESMFYRESNASKVCLAFLIERLQRRQIPWLDCQMVTDFTAAFGAREIPREKFMSMLDEQLGKETSLFQQDQDIGIWKPEEMLGS